MTSPRSGYAEHFGNNNIPFGVASKKDSTNSTCVSRFEDNVIWLAKLDILRNTPDLPEGVFELPTLNAFAALSKDVHSEVRKRIQETINKGLPKDAVSNISEVSMHMPVSVGDFTDFSCSLDHVQNASEAMTGTRSSPPAFFHFPVGYAGRCSSLEVSGTDVERPLGQYWSGKPGQSDVVFGPCKKMDFELELGCIIGRPLDRRRRVTPDQAEEHIFGFCLVNDWSARDIQALEMNPLGPLNGKNAATTLSPWIITTEALQPFHVAAPTPKSQVAPYLTSGTNSALDIKLEVEVRKAEADKGSVVCRSNSSWMYWTLPQCVSHQAIGGCGLRTGDLLATGTVSGGGDDEHGCLMEHMKAGQTPPRGYLEDDETIVLTGFCGEGVGFGECVATLRPAKDF